jgi:hypothetical protein
MRSIVVGATPDDTKPLQCPKHRDFRTIQAVSGQIQDFPRGAWDGVSRMTHEGEGHRMTTGTASRPAEKRSALRAIGVGGLIAGALDLTQACILFGSRIPLVIAAGLLGREALHGGIPTYILGVLLHFFIAFSATAIYYAASRRLSFMKEHPLVCGLVFGAAVEEAMTLAVLPLSALHARGPYELHDLILGLLVHMVVIGLPISFSVRRFAKSGDLQN